MTPSLIDALAGAAKQARVDHGVSREEIAVALGQSADKVRYFENARGFGALDDILVAYEETTGVSLLDLLDEARENLKKNG